MRLLKRPEVTARTGLSKSALYDQVSRGVFPRPVKTSAKAAAWVETEIDAWISAKIAARDAKEERDGGGSHLWACSPFAGARDGLRGTLQLRRRRRG